MTPEELLQRHPAETLRWLRARLGVSRRALAEQIGVPAEQVTRWENGRSRMVLAHHRRIVPLLATHLATPEGAAFMMTLERGEGGE